VTTVRANNRLPGVDGLRAVAALWVVLFHIQAFSGAKFPYIPGLDLFLRSGSTGVSLFLVLSGFCLYLPFAGGRTGRFGTRDFLLRRCRRLMPAYYVSLVFAVALDLATTSWLGSTDVSFFGTTWQTLTHATFMHTLFPSTFYALNGAYWSLGLEWQLYLGLPLLVWGVRRFGLRKTVLAAIVCNVAYRLILALAIDRGLVTRDSLLATAVLPNQLPGRWAEFVYGMVAAELYVTGQVRRWAIPGTFMLPLLIPASLLAVGWPLSHILYGCVFFILLSLVLASENVVSRALSWPPLVAIGTMSYSLYLVHQPVIERLAYVMRAHRQASSVETFFALMLLLPLILLLAWALFMTVERRTLNARPSTTSSQAGVAASPKPTPRRWRPLLGWSFRAAMNRQGGG
jgi:peptidoglycan/LPS O-acetylase OafA/YrhL